MAPRGRIDRRVSIQQLELTQPAGGYGRPLETWIPYATRSAARRDLRGSERFAADQTDATVSAVYTLAEPVDGLAAAMRLVDGSAALDIVAVLEPPARGAGQSVHVRESVT